MIRRYVIACTSILVIAFGVSGLAYAADAGGDFAASCSFQAFIRLTREPPRTPDEQKFVNSLALQQLTSALASGVHGKVAAAQKVNAAALRKATRTLPTPGVGSFIVTVIDEDARRAIRLVNAMCDELVSTIKRQRRQALDIQVAGIRAQITSIQKEVRRLQAIPARRRSTEDNLTLDAQRRALTFNAIAIANVLSLPPDDIAVLTRATSGIHRQRHSLSKNLLIGGLTGVLACFLVVLVGEIVRERRLEALAGAPPARA